MKSIFFRDPLWLNHPIEEKANVLDVGSGGLRRAAHVVTMDILKLEETDIIHDANNYPWPFEENTFDYIIMSNVLEHVENVSALLSEVQRVGKRHALIRCVCPHYSNPCTYVDVTHRHALSIRSLDVFCCSHNARWKKARQLFKKIMGCDIGVADLFRENKFIMIRRSLYFREALWWSLAPIWGNLFQDFYEVYLSKVLPAWAIYWELLVNKE